MTFEEKKHLVWAATYGAAFAARALETERTIGQEAVTDDERTAGRRERLQELSRKVADAAVKDLMWNPLDPV